MRSVVLATPEMVFELAKAVSRGRIATQAGAGEEEGEVAKRGKLKALISAD